MKCPNCGSELDMEQGCCDYCGSSFTPEMLSQISKGIKGAYELTKGDLEKERMLKKADTHLRMKAYGDALRSYRDVSYEYPDDCRGWFGEVKCRTCNLTDYSIGNRGILELQPVIDKALMVATEQKRAYICSAWETYTEKCIRAEEDRLRQAEQKAEQLRCEAEREAQERQRKLTEERARQETEAKEQRRLAEEEKRRQRLKEEAAKRRLFVRKLIFSLLCIGGEIAFFGIMLSNNYVGVINKSFAGFLGINAALLGNALVISILAHIGAVKGCAYLGTGVNAIFAIWIFIEAMGAMEGVIITALALGFFGAIEYGVLWLSYIMAKGIDSNV